MISYIVLLAFILPSVPFIAYNFLGGPVISHLAVLAYKLLLLNWHISSSEKNIV